MDVVWGDFLRPQHGKTPTAVITNQNKTLVSFKSKENLHKKDDGRDCTVSNNKFSSVTLYDVLELQTLKSVVQEAYNRIKRPNVK